jgi:hypothetical protein
MRRIHQPGFSLGAKVIVCLSLPLNVPTPETAISLISVRRLRGKAKNGHRQDAFHRSPAS